MIGVLLVTHGSFSEAIITSMELVFGRQEKLEALTLNHGDDVEELTRQVRYKAKELDDGEGVLVLVDLFGGSPCNVTASCLNQKGIECVTGLNLPMLISVLEGRDMNQLSEMPKLAIEAGMHGIVNVKQMIG